MLLLRLVLLQLLLMEGGCGLCWDVCARTRSESQAKSATEFNKGKCAACAERHNETAGPGLRVLGACQDDDEASSSLNRTPSDRWLLDHD